MESLAIQWGTVGEWVGGLAAAAGLLFAGWEIRENRLERRRAQLEHQEAMARAVSVKAVLDPTEDVTPDGHRIYRMDYSVSNAGEYPIDNAVLVVVDPGAESPDPATQSGTAIEAVLGTLTAGQTHSDSYRLVFTKEPEFDQLTRLATLLFTDTWDQSWHRGPGQLRKLPRPPIID